MTPPCPFLRHSSQPSSVTTPKVTQTTRSSSMPQPLVVSLSKTPEGTEIESLGFWTSLIAKPMLNWAYKWHKCASSLCERERELTEAPFTSHDNVSKDHHTVWTAVPENCLNSRARNLSVSSITCSSVAKRAVSTLALLLQQSLQWGLMVGQIFRSASPDLWNLAHFKWRSRMQNA